MALVKMCPFLSRLDDCLALPPAFLHTHTPCWTSVAQAGRAAAVAARTPSAQSLLTGAFFSLFWLLSMFSLLRLGHGGVSCICLQIRVLVT